MCVSCVCCVFCVVLCVSCVCCVPLRGKFLRRTPSAGPPPLDPFFRWTAQNFALLFSLSRPIFAFFFPLGGFFSLNCGRGPRPWITQSVRFGSLESFFETPAACSRRGSRQEREKARNFGHPTLRGPTLRGPTLRGTTLRAPPFVAINFGPPFGPPPSGPPPFGCPPLAPPFGPPPFGPHPYAHTTHNTHNAHTKKKELA